MAATAAKVPKKRASWAASPYRSWATSLKALSRKMNTTALRMKYPIIMTR